MKAVTYTAYGPPENLRLVDLPTPVPADGQVLVRVRAASVNSWDWDLLRGKPFLARLGGILRPQHRILGADVAGIVEATGPGAGKFKAGDAVFGDLSGAGWGGFAEYVAVAETALTLKPAGISFEAAASLPQAGLLAWQGVDGLGAGQSVLVNGAGGGVGTFALQLARRVGARVTGVDHGDKFDTMRAAGADQVLDYTTTDFAANGQRYDLILDMVAAHPVAAYRRSLTPNGRLAIVGGRTGTIFKIALAGAIGAKQLQKLGLLMYRTNAGLDALAALVAAGEITPVIDTVYPLAQTADALRQIGGGRVKGKLVITP